MSAARDPALARKAAADLLYVVLIEQGLDRGPTDREVDRLLAAAAWTAPDAAGLRAEAERIVAPAVAVERRPAAGICTIGEGARFGRLRR